MDDLVKRLRDTPNWMRESFGSWKDCGVLKYDRAPFEAADALERLTAERDALQAKLDALMMECCPDAMTDEQRARWGRP